MSHLQDTGEMICSDISGDEIEVEHSREQREWNRYRSPSQAWEEPCEQVRVPHGPLRGPKAHTLQTNARCGVALWETPLVERHFQRVWCCGI